MVSKLQKNKNQILFIELAGLLHDIGKLSKAFLEYRQTWQGDPNGYYKDPHDHDYFDEHEKSFKDLIPAAFRSEIKELGGYNYCEPDFSIKKAVHCHVSPKTGALINLMLKAADGVDSAIDRNNPLWSAEQFGRVFKSNVFGYEHGRIVTLESQEEARKGIYNFLNQHLDTYFRHFDVKQRDNLFEAIKKAFEQGLADTTRPSNDTTLWEHSFAVASILKVLAVHNLLNDDEKIYKFEDVKFGIYGIGWNGMRFMSYGQRIGDITGRERIINDVKKDIKKLIEHEYPIGNEIFADNDGIYFIVPTGFDLNGRLKEIRDEIESKIYERTAKQSKGELFPHLVGIEDTNTLTSLVRAITQMKEKVVYPYDQSVVGFKHYERFLRYGENKTICPICRLRPVEDDNAKKKICKVCEGRRVNKENDSNESVFIDEIVDKGKRAALIIARFGLDEWLNGRMVRSLFVTEANGIKEEINRLPITKQFEKEEEEVKEFFETKYGEVNYSRIKDDIDSFAVKDSERAKYTAFLYDRRVDRGKIRNRDTEKIYKRWLEMWTEAQKEHPGIDIYNLLNAKTPTPSTILDVWSTTLGFVTDMAQTTMRSLFPEQRRLGLNVTCKNDAKLPEWSGTKEAEIVSSGRKIELYMEDGKIEVVGEIYSDNAKETWNRQEIKIADNDKGSLLKVRDCYSGNLFLPYRTISKTPNLFMALVPADRVVEITDLIYMEYINRFGKVLGRLPFSIGNIFFGSKIPMFVVLDAGKRMIANFDALGKNEKKKEFTVYSNKEETSSDITFSLKCKIEGLDRALTWRLPHKLGNCAVDYHHPYFIVKKDSKDYSSRTNYFKTVAGEVIHFSDVEAEDSEKKIKGDVLEMHPNYYDFEFLDSNARRYDIGVDGKGRRRSNVADFKSKPFLLDELNQKIVHIWKDLLKDKQLKGITDTKLRNLQFLWLTKYQEWVREDNPAGVVQWREFIKTSLKKEFGISEQGILNETIENGLFFDTLELYLGILKERIDDKKGGN